MQSAVWLNSAAETNHYKISHMSGDCAPRGTLGYTNCSSLKCGCLYSEICSNRTTFITCLSVTDFKVNQVEIRTTIFLWLFGLGSVLVCMHLFVLNPATQDLCLDLLHLLWCIWGGDSYFSPLSQLLLQ